MFSKLVILDLGNPIIYIKLIRFEKKQYLWILSILKAKFALTNVHLTYNFFSISTISTCERNNDYCAIF